MSAEALPGLPVLPEWATDRYLIAQGLLLLASQRWNFANEVGQDIDRKRFPRTEADECIAIARRVSDLALEWGKPE